ncbi:tail tape measure protein [Shigella phage Sf12]|uniref:Tape measure protein n=1 Tax=Shigella phage Sf12 TaxID=2024315 RepID=A0A291AXR5_9CAUD|nr:tail length tape measure protein [Shigella phage Sf12]ATE85773.1 tail tape measure protein [Shigella phage Sf12]
MAEFAGITLGVDVRQVEQGTKSLQEFKRANEQAASGVDKFVNAEQVARTIARDTARATQEQQIAFQRLSQTIDPTASKLQKLRVAAEGLDKAFAAGVVPDEQFFRLGEVLETQENRLRRSAAALTEEGRASLAASREKEKLASAGQRFIESLRQQELAAGRTTTELLELRAAQLGVSDQAAPLIQSISQRTNANVEALGRQAEAFRKSGLSAGQYKNAIAQLPAQITDIGTSIAGGIPLWLIAIQQGGQIKDSFGGVANTFRFLLSYINPVTASLGVLAIAFTTLGVSIFNSQKRLEEGTAAVQKSLGLTGDSASRLGQLVADLAEETGKSAESIAQAFVSTTDGALEAELALIDVGLSYEEARELVDQYKDASNFTAVNAKIAEHKAQVAGIADSYKQAATEVGFLTRVLQQLGNSQVSNNARVQRSIDDIAITATDLNNALREGARERAETVAAIDKEYFATDRVAGATRALQQAESQLNKIRLSGNAEAIRQANRIVEIRKEELAEANKPRNGRRTTERQPRQQRDLTQDAEAGVIALEAQLRVLKDQELVGRTLSQQRKQLIDEQARFAVIEERINAGTANAAQRELFAKRDIILAEREKSAILGDQIQQQEAANKLLDENIRKTNQINAQTEALSLGAGLSRREQERQREIAALTAQQVNRGGSVDDTDFQALLQARQNFYNQEDALRGNWLAGVRSAFAETADELANFNQIGAELATSAFNGLTDQITNLVTTGEANFREFTASILKQIARIATQLLLIKAIESTISSFGGSGGAIGSIGSAFGFASGGYTGNGGKYEPAGTVHRGEFVFTKEATSRIGVDNLYKLMRGYANGGVVGSGPGYATGGLVGGSNVNVGGVNVTVQTGLGGGGGNDAKQLESGIRVIIAEEITQSFQQGGTAYQFLRGYS